MKDVSPEERPLVGQMVNETRAAIEQKLEETKKENGSVGLEHKLKKEVIDVTLPAKEKPCRSWSSEHHRPGRS